MKSNTAHITYGNINYVVFDNTPKDIQLCLRKQTVDREAFICLSFVSDQFMLSWQWFGLFYLFGLDNNNNVQYMFNYCAKGLLC